MNRRRLTFLFLTNLILLTVASGLIPLIPLRAIQLGATASGAGSVLSLGYGAVLLGTLAAGRLATAHPSHNRKFFHLAVAGTVAGFYLAGEAGTLLLYTAGILLAWFSGGFQVVMVNIYTGFNAGGQNRGRIFTLINTAGPVGAMIGGFASGRLVDAYGYQTLFRLSAVSQLVLLPLGAVALQRQGDAGTRSTTSARTSIAAASLPLPGAFWTLLASTLLVGIAAVLGRLGTTLLMESARFSATAISGVAAVGGLFTIPLLPLIGMLSDRGRPARGSSYNRFLIVSYLLSLVGLLLLRQASALWQFTTVAASLALAGALVGSLAAARATEMVPRASVARALSYLNSINWIAMILGFAAGGYLLERWTPADLYLVTALLPLLASGLLLAGEMAGRRQAALSKSAIVDGAVGKEETVEAYAAGS